MMLPLGVAAARVAFLAVSLYHIFLPEPGIHKNVETQRKSYPLVCHMSNYIRTCSVEMLSPPCGGDNNFLILSPMSYNFATLAALDDLG